MPRLRRAPAITRCLLRAVGAALALAACSGDGAGGPPAPPPIEPAAALVLESGGGQRARVTQQLGTPIVVRVRAASGTPVANASLQAAVTTGTVTPATIVTDASGAATLRWQLGPSAGEQRLTVQLTTGNVAPVVVTAIADPALSVRVAIVDGDRQQAVVSTATVVAPTIRVLDTTGAPVPGVRTRFTAIGSSVAVAEPVTDALGRATVGAWVMGGSPGSAQLSVVLLDQDVVATDAPPSFSAVAVAVGGIATSPSRDYVLQSVAPHTVMDSVAQLRIVFPAGASGTLSVSRIVGGPAAPVPGATRAFIVFDGPQPLELELTPTPTGEPAAYQYSVREVAIHGVTGEQWRPLPQRDMGATVRFGVDRLDASARMTETAPQRFRLSTGAHVVLGLLPVTAAERIAFSGLKAEARRTINYWINTVPNEALRDNMRSREAASPLAFSYGFDCPSAYERFLPSPHIHFCREAASHTPSHEAGHYLTDLMLNGPRWTQIANLAPGMLFPGVDHDFGKAIGFRMTITEDYAFLASFLLYGTLPSFTTTYDPTAKISGSGIATLLGYSSPPSAIDGPSREGFATVMLATLMRAGADTLVKDFTDEITRSPALGFTPSDVMGILSHGPRNVMDLREELLIALDDDEATLAAVLEPMGWSYTGGGRLVDAAGEPIVGATVASIVRIDGAEYGTPVSAMTTGNGIFVLPRVYPGTSTLRVYRPRASGGLDSVDVQPLTVPWTRPTTDVVNIGDLVYSDLSTFNGIQINVDGVTAPNSRAAQECRPSFIASEILPSSFTGTTSFPLRWSGLMFSTQGSTAYEVPTGYTSGPSIFRSEYSVSVTGGVTRRVADTLWLQLNARRTTRQSQYTMDSGAGAGRWDVTVISVADFRLLDFPVVASPSFLRGTLTGAPAIATFGPGWQFRYLWTVPDAPWISPQYDCTAFTLGAGTRVEVRLVRR